MPECNECESSWLYRTTINANGEPEYCPFCGSDTGPQFDTTEEEDKA